MWFLFDTFPPYLTLSKYCWHLAFDNTTFGTFYCFLMLLSFKMSHHEAYWGWKCRSCEHFWKKFSWTTKNWKNSFLSYKCNFHILCISDLFKLRFELSLLLHLTPTLSAPLTFCKFAQKWGRFHLKQCYTKMTASTRRSFWYLMILTWNAVHNPLESIEGKVLQFYDFNKFSSVFSRALS